jgi:hypothetical protein
LALPNAAIEFGYADFQMPELPEAERARALIADRAPDRRC